MAREGQVKGSYCNSLGMAHTVEDWSAFIIKRHVSED